MCGAASGAQGNMGLGVHALQPRFGVVTQHHRLNLLHAQARHVHRHQPLSGCHEDSRRLLGRSTPSMLDIQAPSHCFVPGWPLAGRPMQCLLWPPCGSACAPHGPTAIRRTRSRLTPRWGARNRFGPWCVCLGRGGRGARVQAAAPHHFCTGLANGLSGRNAQRQRWVAPCA